MTNTSNVANLYEFNVKPIKPITLTLPTIAPAVLIV